MIAFIILAGSFSFSVAGAIIAIAWISKAQETIRRLRMLSIIVKVGADCRQVPEAPPALTPTFKPAAN